MLRDMHHDDITIGLHVVKKEFGRYLYGVIVGKKGDNIVVIRWSDDWNDWPYYLSMCNFQVLDAV